MNQITPISLGLVLLGIVPSVVVALLSAAPRKTMGVRYYIDYAARDCYSEQHYDLVVFGRALRIRIWGWLRRFRVPIPVAEEVAEIRYVSGRTAAGGSIPDRHWEERQCRVRTFLSGSVVRHAQVHKAFFRRHHPEMISLVSRKTMTYADLTSKVHVTSRQVSHSGSRQRTEYLLRNDWDRHIREFTFPLDGAEPIPDEISVVRAEDEEGSHLEVDAADILMVHEIAWDFHEMEVAQGRPVPVGHRRLELRVPVLATGTTRVVVDYAWRLPQD